MADFEFYQCIYLGSAIPQKAFAEFAQRAKDALERMMRTYRITASGETSLAMAICAMAETLYAHAKHRSGMTAATVGQVSVRYENSDSGEKSLQRELYRKASIYLDIYRGVSQ